ncbi:class I SAM-dependent methyltransferase [Niabella ginsengisoli]|uniref:Class I SAM-dependent methyltransferase n=1 Tax=Niabella ginsengisoli TaxID=522298 RepID=A0ABS9SHS4_9BACT|nr:class I SAM-dependent methyltransferase [Niabella ginsengisoli]MCH5597912.1 class I SAM-dependent methyltransferase [Niabella ginsengisoli]
MKVRNPKSRFDLRIPSHYKVLDVGGGHNPHPRANVVVDKYTNTNYHRSGDIKVLKKQEFINADGENLPFSDNEFDYVICCQVLEHVENPHQFLAELFRVGKKGYIETPSLIGEYLFPRESHKWILHEINNTLHLLDKETLGFTFGYNMTELIQDYLPTHSIGFKILERTHPNLITVRIEWENDFEYEVESQDPEVRKFFKGSWQSDWQNDFFPKRTMFQELKEATIAFKDITKSVIRSRIVKK